MVSLTVALERIPNLYVHPYPSYLLNLPRADGKVSNYPWTASYFIGLSADKPAAAAAAAAVVAAASTSSTASAAPDTKQSEADGKQQPVTADFSSAADQFSEQFNSKWQQKPNGSVLALSQAEAASALIRKAKLRITPKSSAPSSSS